MDQLERFIHKVSLWFDRISQGSLVIMMLLIMGNVFTRLFGHPIPGTYEITGYLGGVLIAFALAWCGILGHHIALTMLVDRLSPKTRTVIGITVGIISFGFLIIGTWQCVQLGINSWRSGELSPDLKFPVFPLMWGVGLGCLMLSAVFLLNVLKLAREVVKWIPLRSA